MKTDTKPIEAWKGYFEKIKRFIDVEGYTNILQCYEVRRAVAVGNAPHIRHKLHWMQSLPSYKNHYEKLLQDDWIGNPTRLPRNNPFTSGARINMLYHIIQLLNYGINILDYQHIFEFGGGYGCLCEMLHKAGFVGSYTIYDVPVMSGIQEWYLSHYDQQAKCTCKLEKVPDPGDKKSAFIATMSFSEIPISERIQVEKMIKDYDLIFIAYAADFVGIDNLGYFNRFRRKLKSHQWDEWDIDRDIGVTRKRKGKRYLVGVKK